MAKPKPEVTSQKKLDVPPALESIFSEIDKAYQNSLYYLAVSVTLTIPDLCAGAELDLSGGATVKKAQYIAWCQSYLVPMYKHLQADDFYHLRSGIIHTGIFGHPQSRFDRPYFTGPRAPIRVHEIFMAKMGPANQSAVGLDIEEFVKSMKAATETWWKAKQSVPNVQDNVERIVRLRPQGISPFIEGVPVVG